MIPAPSACQASVVPFSYELGYDMSEPFMNQLVRWCVCGAVGQSSPPVPFMCTE